MLWSEIKRWAKEQGYETLKDDKDETGTKYYWSKVDDINSSGVAPSVSKLARAIYNDITNNIWVDHQNEYINQNNT